MLSLVFQFDVQAFFFYLNLCFVLNKKERVLVKMQHIGTQRSQVTENTALEGLVWQGGMNKQAKQ